MSLKKLIRNNRGFTLLEVMVAVMIIMVGMIGLLETISISMQHNMKNQFRNEAIHIGERYMAELKGKPFGKYSAPYTPMNVPSRIRGINKTYRVERTHLALANDASGPTSEQLSVTVKWYFKNQSSLNQVVSVVARP